MATATGLATQGEVAGLERARVGSSRRADIQGLRGIAVLLVVAFHAAVLVPGGYIGVDVFFVISGFVITSLLLREVTATEQIAFRQFYARRIRRLLPPLALLIIVVCLGGVLFLSPLGTQQQTGMLARSAATFRSNFSLYAGKNRYFDISANNNPLLHTWSLGVEEQFYLLFPAFLIAAWRWSVRLVPSRSRRRGTAILTLVVAGVSLWLSIDLTAGHDLGSTIARPSLFAFYSLPTRAWEFAFGTLTALAVPWLRRQRADLSVLAGALGFVLVLASARLMTTFTPFPGSAALIPVGGAALVIAAGTLTNRGVARLLACRPLVWLGDLSYSWYLWHWPLIVFAAAIWPTHGRLLLPLAAALSLIPSWLSYRYVEQPFRARAPWTRRRALSIATICIAAPLAVSLLAPQLTRAVVSHAKTTSLERQLRPHEMNGGPCVGAVQSEPRRKCTAAPDGASRGEIWLVGDSQAGMLTEPATRAAVRAGYGLTTSLFYQCPFADVILSSRADGVATDCAKFVRGTVDNLVARRPKLVIIASESADYINGPGFKLRGVQTGSTARTPEAKARLWQQGLARLLAQFERASIPTLVVNTIPHFANWDPRACAAVVIANEAGRCGTSRSTSSVHSDQRLALASEQAATRATGADMIDFTDLLCTPRRCATNDGNFFVYMDGHHLSADGALRLVNVLGERIARDANG